MKPVESIYAAHEIAALMASARKSVEIFAPKGWAFFSFENYSAIVHEAAERGIRARFVFGASVLPTELRDLSQNGSHIRIVRELGGPSSYLIVDSSRGIQGEYVPRRGSPYLAFASPEDSSTIRDLLRHFEGVWDGATALEILFSASRMGVGRLIQPLPTEVLSWSARLKMLAEHPDDLDKLRPREFEELVAELFSRDGFDTILTPKTHDGGRDVIASITIPTGKILCLVECKRYAKDRPVGIEHVRALLGTVTSEGATNGLIVTTSAFTGPAQRFAHSHSYRLALKEREKLITWLPEIAGR